MELNSLRALRREIQDEDFESDDENERRLVVPREMVQGKEEGPPRNSSIPVREDGLPCGKALKPGSSGRGGGIVAAALTEPPMNLKQLAMADRNRKMATEVSDRRGEGIRRNEEERKEDDSVRRDRQAASAERVARGEPRRRQRQNVIRALEQEPLSKSRNRKGTRPHSFSVTRPSGDGSPLSPRPQPRWRSPDAPDTSRRHSGESRVMPRWPVLHQSVGTLRDLKKGLDGTDDKQALDARPMPLVPTLYAPAVNSA